MYICEGLLKIHVCCLVVDSLPLVGSSATCEKEREKNYHSAVACLIVEVIVGAVYLLVSSRVDR